MNVNIEFPNNKIHGEESYDIMKNDNNGTFSYKVHTKTAGEYTIYCDKLSENYVFTILPNAPYLKNMKAYLNKDSMVAGDSVNMKVQVYDKYWNAIKYDTNQKAIAIVYRNEDNSNVSVPFN